MESTLQTMALVVEEEKAVKFGSFTAIGCWPLAVSLGFRVTTAVGCWALAVSY